MHLKTVAGKPAILPADMEMLAYTVAGIILYLISDWILNRVEVRRGARFDNRTLIFFAILLTLTLVCFQLIQYFLTPPATPPAP